MIMFASAGAIFVYLQNEIGHLKKEVTELTEKQNVLANFSFRQSRQLQSMGQNQQPQFMNQPALRPPLDPPETNKAENQQNAQHEDDESSNPSFDTYDSVVQVDNYSQNNNEQESQQQDEIRKASTNDEEDDFRIATEDTPLKEIVEEAKKSVDKKTKKRSAKLPVRNSSQPNFIKKAKSLIIDTEQEAEDDIEDQQPLPSVIVKRRGRPPTKKEQKSKKYEPSKKTMEQVMKPKKKNESVEKGKQRKEKKSVKKTLTKKRKNKKSQDSVIEDA